MDKNNIELFKQAISEGLAGRLDKVVNGYTQEIACSQQHRIAMAKIVYGEQDMQKVLSPKMKKTIAILVAAALLLTGCGIVFRNEIREIIEEVSEFFVELTYSSNRANGSIIEEIYELSYVPDEYYLENSIISPTMTKYVFSDASGSKLFFEQNTLNNSFFIVDIEHGYSLNVKINNYDIYYKNLDDYHLYLWNDGKYSMTISLYRELSVEELDHIINGIRKK